MSTDRAKPKRVALTGATGFLGAAIARELLSAGIKVTALVRPDSNLARLQRLPSCGTLRYTRMLDEVTVEALTSEKPDVFVHCGWRGVGGRDRNEAFQVTSNIPATLDSVELAVAAGCGQWIGLGSQAEYGNPNCRIDEQAPTRPTTIYGKAKLAAGVAAQALCEARNINAAWIRIFSTYGPDDAPGWFIPHVIQEFIAGRSPRLTACEQLWDYLYVEDAARAITAVASSSAGGLFNLGSGTARPLKEYVQSIRRELDSSAAADYGALPYRPDQVMHLEANIQRLKSLTGWAPCVSIDDGIRATVAFERGRGTYPCNPT